MLQYLHSSLKNHISLHAAEFPDDAETNDEISREQQFIQNVLSTKGRGGGSTRGGGPGRRVLKLGIGGFNVRNSKNRLSSMASITNFPNDDDGLQSPGVDEVGSLGLGTNGKPRIRRPRRLRKPLLEDAYPPNIQARNLHNPNGISFVLFRNPFLVLLRLTVVR